jgi:hypothetical protein
MGNSVRASALFPKKILSLYKNVVNVQLFHISNILDVDERSSLESMGLHAMSRPPEREVQHRTSLHELNLHAVARLALPTSRQYALLIYIIPERN